MRPSTPVRVTFQLAWNTSAPRGRDPRGPSGFVVPIVDSRTGTGLATIMGARARAQGWMVRLRCCRREVNDTGQHLSCWSWTSTYLISRPCFPFFPCSARHDFPAASSRARASLLFASGRHRSLGTEDHLLRSIVFWKGKTRRSRRAIRRRSERWPARGWYRWVLYASL